jgi:hypothetical protein
MNGDLDIKFIGNAKASVDCRGSRPPILVQFQTDCPRSNLLPQGLGRRAVAFAKKTEIHRILLGGLEHPMDVPMSGCARRGVSTGRRAGSSSDHRCDPAGDRMFDLLRADEVDMGVQAAGGDDAALAGYDLGRRTDNHCYSILNKGISGVPDPRDTTFLDSDVAFNDALNGVKDKRVGNHQIEGFRVGGERRLTHAVANDFASAKFDFAAVSAVFRNQVAFDFDEQLRIGQANLIANRGTEHFRIKSAREFHGVIRAFRSPFR